MGVMNGYRRRGIGTRLLAAAIKKPQANGLTRIELEVYATNQGAIVLYERFGFVREGVRRRARYVDGIWDDFVMMTLFGKGGLCLKV
jgi:ribosomal protein S18 acetylase RimI-like enzyme